MNRVNSVAAIINKSPTSTRLLLAGEATPVTRADHFVPIGEDIWFYGEDAVHGRAAPPGHVRHPGAEDGVDQVRKRHLSGLQAYKGQRGEQRHHPLREIEDARCLEDQNEAERDQRIEDAGNETFPDDLDEQVRGLAHLDEWIDKNLVENVHRLFFSSARSAVLVKQAGELRRAVSRGRHRDTHR